MKIAPALPGLLVAFCAMTPANASTSTKVKFNFVSDSPISKYKGKRTVDFNESYKPGNIVIKTAKRKLYFVLPGGRAIEYGVGVGRYGFTWSGRTKVTRKAKWPGWVPPAEMHARQPGLPKFMPGGPDNPLGARALYLGSSLYRIHGTNQDYTIGQAVSSGCIRMVNEEVIDLYNRVDVGTRVIVTR